MSYRVVVIREHKSWLADVPELEGAHTWATNLPAVDRAVREVIILAADLDEDEGDGLELDWDIHTGDADLDEELAELRRKRAEMTQLESDVVRGTAISARHIVRTGFPVRRSWSVCHRSAYPRSHAKRSMPDGEDDRGRRGRER